MQGAGSELAPPASERDRLYREAAAHDRAGRADEARAIVERCLRSDPLDTPFLLLKAMIDLRQEALASVDMSTRRAAVIDPATSRASFIRTMLLALLPDGATAWRMLRRAHCIAGQDRVMFPEPPRQAILPSRLLSSLDDEMLRKSWARLHACWGDAGARGRLVTGLLRRHDTAVATDVARCFLLDNPTDPEGWRRLSPVMRRVGDERAAFEVQLRAGVIAGFASEMVFPQLFFQRRRAKADVRRLLTYSREHARRSVANTEILLALWRTMLAADPVARVSGDALRRAANELAPVAEARVLAPVSYSKITKEPLVALTDAMVTYDLIHARVIVGPHLIATTRPSMMPLGCSCDIRSRHRARSTRRSWWASRGTTTIG
jgi:hypothetical protein